MNSCCFLILTFFFFFWLCWFFVAVHRLFSSYGVGELLLLVVGSLPSHCGGARALVAEHGSRHSWASVVMARGLWVQAQSLWDMGLSCSAACGIFPDQGSHTTCPTLAGRFLTTGLPGKSSSLNLNGGYMNMRKLLWWTLLTKMLTFH